MTKRREGLYVTAKMEHGDSRCLGCDDLRIMNLRVFLYIFGIAFHFIMPHIKRVYNIIYSNIVIVY